MKRKIVLRHCHDRDMAGTVIVMEDDCAGLDVPMICGCIAEFAPLWGEGYIEHQEVNGDMCEIWKQVGFRFNEYVPSL